MRFVVIGRFSVELWDVAVAPTLDIDITPEMSSANLGRLATALDVLNAAIRFSGGVVEVPGVSVPR